MPTPRHSPDRRTSPSLPPSASQGQEHSSEEEWQPAGVGGVLTPQDPSLHPGWLQDRGWSPQGMCPRGWSPSSLGRRGRGPVPSALPPGPGWGPGRLPCWNLYLFVFILSSCPPGSPAGQPSYLKNIRDWGSLKEPPCPHRSDTPSPPCPHGGPKRAPLAQGGQGLPCPLRVGWRV